MIIAHKSADGSLEYLSTLARDITERKRAEGEVVRTVQLLRECTAEAKHDAETPQEVKERLTSMLEFLEEMSGWYDQIRSMPRPTLLKLMRMGARVAKAVG